MAGTVAKSCQMGNHLDLLLNADIESIATYKFSTGIEDAFPNEGGFFWLDGTVYSAQWIKMWS